MQSLRSNLHGFKSKVLLDSVGLPDRPEAVCFVLTTWRYRFLAKAGGSYSPSWAELEHQGRIVATRRTWRFERKAPESPVVTRLDAMDSIAAKSFADCGK
jgi:hypothetical protein